MATVYRIRRKSDGLFSTGGMSPHFSKKGKLWSRKGDLSNHLNICDREVIKMYKQECKVVTYDLVEIELDDTVSIQSWIDGIEERKQAREEAYQRRIQEYQATQRRQLYEQLKQEIDGDGQTSNN